MKKVIIAGLAALTLGACTQRSERVTHTGNSAVQATRSIAGDDTVYRLHLSDTAAHAYLNMMIERDNQRKITVISPPGHPYRSLSAQQLDSIYAANKPQ